MLLVVAFVVSVWVAAATLVWLLLYAQAEQRERAFEDSADV
ncbi:MAG: hypothetical protein ABEI99_01130 [Halobaculum sp.]